MQGIPSVGSAQGAFKGAMLEKALSGQAIYVNVIIRPDTIKERRPSPRYVKPDHPRPLRRARY